MRIPFCPSPFCLLHDPRIAGKLHSWATKIGFHSTSVVGPVQRYRCRCCRHSFSDRTFTMDYYTKMTIPYHQIMERLSSSESIRALSRNLRCSPGSILTRIDRLSRECLAHHHGLLAAHRLSEDLAADGFESFDVSQYFPNNINLLVGTRSQFVYGFSHTTIRRKGAMTETQRRRRARLELRYRAPSSGIRDSFRELLSLIPRLWDRDRLPTLRLWTDEHRAYPQAVGQLASLAQAQGEGIFEHKRVSSRLARTVDNPLFSVNYLDRELRKDLAAHRRETTCFVRNVANGLNRLIVYLYWHNYRKPWRIRTARVEEPPHGVVAGMKPRAIRRAEREMSRRRRSFLSHLSLDSVELRCWLKAWETPLWGTDAYLPAFARG